MQCARTFLFRTSAPGNACFRSARRRSMSWTCHGTNNDELVAALQREKLVVSERVSDAMKAVDRGCFCPDKKKAYIDAPQPIGFNATISAPHMHAICLEAAIDHLQPGNKVLDVGSGSGYLTAILAHMVAKGNEGKAIGMEHIPELTERATSAASQLPSAKQMMQKGTLEYLTADGFQGWKESSPYDVIHVGAAASSIPPALTQQLKAGGRLIVPVGEVGRSQSLVIVDKDQAGQLSQRNICNVQYVPLTSRAAQLL